jgi:adenosylcobyric acid synthase
LGICGGYQLLGRQIRDPSGVESNVRNVKGLNLQPVETTLEENKIVRRVNGHCIMTGKRVSGYEIHMGQSRIMQRTGRPFLKIHQPGKRHVWEDGCSVNGWQICGTYVHGIMDAPGFRGNFLNRLRSAKGLKSRLPKQGRLARFHQYDRLADHFERHCDLDRILACLED